MNNNANKKIFITILIAILLIGGWIIFKENIGAVHVPPTMPAAGSKGDNSQTAPAAVPGITVPAGFTLSIFAKNVPDARVIELDPLGRVLVSETSKGKIVALTSGGNSATLASGLNDPHGLAMKCASDNSNCFLYVAERNMLSRYSYNVGDANSAPSLGAKENLMPITSSGGDQHFTRSLQFLPAPHDTILLISVGSSCNVCNDTGDHAKILSYNIDTKQKSVYATGLRNATFMAIDPANGKVFATEMGRDYLGDNIPPDEINIIQKGGNYGWPFCYGKNIPDTNFDGKTTSADCAADQPSFIDLQAHSAPLGLAFVPSSWPEEYRGDLLVAYHGSWNRSTPTGYKIVRITFDSQGNYASTEDFATGWLRPNGSKLGRPVDIKMAPDGTIYISDDTAGVIYRLVVTN